MAANELGSYPVLDLTFKNATASTIAANLAVLASTAPTGDTPGCVVLPTASGGVVGTIGVTVEAIPATELSGFRVADDMSDVLVVASFGEILKSDVLDLAPSHLRAMFALAPQEPFLFSDTVAANVTFGGDDATLPVDTALIKAVHLQELRAAHPRERHLLLAAVASRLLRRVCRRRRHGVATFARRARRTR